MSVSKIISLKRDIYIVMLLFSVITLSGCGSSVNVSEDSVRTPNLSLVTSSPSNLRKPIFKVENIEQNASIGIYSDSDCVQSLEIDSSSITSTGIGAVRLSLLNELSTDGNYFYYAKQRNGNGKYSSCSSGVLYTLDTMTSSLNLVLAAGITSPSNNTTPSFLVSNVKEGALVSLYTDSECLEANKVSSGTASDDSIILVLATALSSDGVYTYYSKQIKDGESSSCSSGISYTLDTVTSRPNLTLGAGTFSSSSDTTPSFFISDIENGALISLHTDSACTNISQVASGIATSDSITLELQTALIRNEIYTYYAKQIDRVGNVSLCSNSISYTLSTLISIPILSRVTPSESNVRKPIFEAANLVVDGNVSIYLDSNCTQEVETDPNSIISILPSTIRLSLLNELSEDGDYSFYAKQIKDDESSPCSSGVPYILDTIAYPPWFSPREEFGSSTTIPSFSIYFENGALVSLHTDSECLEINKVSFEKVDISYNSFTAVLQAALNSDGAYTYYAKQVDIVGNISDCSESFTYTLDRDISLPTIALVQGITSPSNNTRPSFVVSNVEDRAFVSLHTDSDCHNQAVASSRAIGDSITIKLNRRLSDGIYTYYVRQADRAGNSSCSSIGVEYELDTVVPVAPVINLTQGITSPSNNTAPSFIVSDLEEDATVSLHEGACEYDAIVSGVATGNSIILSINLTSDGSYFYRAKQTDRAGNFTCSSSYVQYKLDTAIAVPMIDLAQGITSPSNNIAPSFVVSGVERGSSVSLHIDSECLEANKIRSGTAKTNSITLQTFLDTDGSYTYYTKQIDRVGNVSDCSVGLVYELNSVALSVPTIAFAQGTSSPSNNTIPNFFISGVKEEALVSLHTDSECLEANKIASGTTSGDFITLALQTSLISYGSYTYYTKQIDKLGNPSSCSNGISYEFFHGFESVWRVGVEGYGNGDNTATLPLIEADEDGNNFVYDFTVDWGDGSTDKVTSWNDLDKTHTYQSTGDYIIKITGTLEAWSYYERDICKITEVKNLGRMGWRSLRAAFFDCKKLNRFTAGMTDTSQVTSMDWIFSNVSSLTSLDLSNFDTSSVMDMRSMFSDASSLTSLDLSGFNTENVMDMRSMFSYASSLTSLDLSGWDTSKVKYMYLMFNGASSLTSLDLSSFNTENVMDMRGMFSYASSLTSLDLSSFNTSNVTTMYGMFFKASALTSLNLSSFNTSNVTTMVGMFNGASSLTSIDLSNFDTSSVTNMSRMFSVASSLTSLDLSNFDTSSVMDMRSMFSVASSLTSLDLSGFNTENVMDMSSMFSHASSLTSLDLSNFDTSNVTVMGWMFNGASSLTSLDLSGLDTSKVTDMSAMFFSSAITSVDLSNFDTSSVTNMSRMFSDASSLTSLDLSNFDTSSVTNMSRMFSGATGLTSLDLSNWDTSNVRNLYSMFNGASSLTSLDISGWDTSGITEFSDVFSNTNSFLEITCSNDRDSFFGKACATGD